jgi:hypothetical protein
VSCANRIIDVREPLRSLVDAVRTIDAVRTAHRILRIHEFYGITDIGIHRLAYGLEKSIVSDTKIGSFLCQINDEKIEKFR